MKEAGKRYKCAGTGTDRGQYVVCNEDSDCTDTRKQRIE